MCEHEMQNQKKKTTAMNWNWICLGTENFNLCSHCKILLLLLFHSTFRSFQSGEKMSAKSHGAFIHKAFWSSFERTCEPEKLMQVPNVTDLGQ
jgi:hypothetical protein